MSNIFAKLNLGLVAAASLSLASVASATIVVQNSDFVDSNYTFTSNGTQLTTSTPAYVNGAAQIVGNMDWVVEGGGQHFATPYYYDGEQYPRFFILAFDFSQVSDPVSGFTVDYDRVNFFEYPVNSKVTVEWSTNMADWNFIRSVTSVDGVVVNSVYSGSEVALNDPDVFYYRVLFGANDPTQPADFAGYATQWGRSGDTDTAFQISFSTVPEPSSVVLMALGGAVLVVLGVRKMRNQRAA